MTIMRGAWPLFKHRAEIEHKPTCPKNAVDVCDEFAVMPCNCGAGIPWLTPTDSLPDVGVVVLVEFDDGSIALDSLEEIEDGIFDWESQCDVAYWLPIPERNNAPR